MLTKPCFPDRHTSCVHSDQYLARPWCGHRQTMNRQDFWTTTLIESVSEHRVRHRMRIREGARRAGKTHDGDAPDKKTTHGPSACAPATRSGVTPCPFKILLDSPGGAQMMS